MSTKSVSSKLSNILKRKEDPKHKIPDLPAVEDTPLVGIRDKAEEVYTSIKNGNGSIRWVALICGAALVADSFVEFCIALFQNADIMQATLDAYAFVLGTFAIAMESDQEAIPYSRRVRKFLGKNLGMVRNVTGRGVFYGIAGSLEMMSDGWRSKSIGGCLIIVGILYIYLGRLAAIKVKSIRNKEYPEVVIKSKFKKYTRNNDDCLSFDDFHSLLNDLMVDINVREAELIYVSLDKSLDRGLSFEGEIHSYLQ